MPQPSVLLLAGEASGDYHAAALVRELKHMHPGLHVCGIGGDKLADAGMELFHHYREVNTIGLSEGLSKVRSIYRAYQTMKTELRSGRHRVFIPVDFPDVNLRLCRFAHGAGVRVCYFISPQIWAWRRGRIHKIARRVDRMMTIFPFEETFYRDAGIKADFVGHTMARDRGDLPDKAQLAAELGIDRSKPVIALVPGSRPAEISRMLPVMAEAARMYAHAYPDAQFLLPLAGPHLSGLVEEILSRYPIAVDVRSTDAFLVMAAADCGLVTSGTATLQAALAEMPHAVVYMLDAFTWWFALNVLKPLVMDQDIHVAIANVLAINKEKQGHGPIQEMLDAGFRIPCQECGRPLFVPELLQHQVTPENLAEWLTRFSRNADLRAAMVRGFQHVRAMLDPSAARQSAAAIVLKYLEG
jgi:lipid-A-disaccharide synthase